MVDWKPLIPKVIDAVRWLILVVLYGALLIVTSAKISHPSEPAVEPAFQESDFQSLDDGLVQDFQRAQARHARRRWQAEPPAEERAPRQSIPPDKRSTAAVAFSLMDSSRFPLSLVWLLLLSLPLTLASERKEKGLIAGDKEDFTGGALFLRYGHEIFRSSFSITFEERQSKDALPALANQLRLRLADRLEDKLPSEIGVAKALAATNLNTNHQKVFLRVLARTARGSHVAHFTHFDPLGQTFTAHYMTFSRGLKNPLEFLRFTLESPVRIWFWFFPWKLGRYSILNEVSSFAEDSFDVIDLRTRYQTVSELLWEETKEVFREFGLLTEAIERIIVNNFANAQQVNIGSPNAQLFSVSHSAGAKITQVGSVEARGASHAA